MIVLGERARQQGEYEIMDHNLTLSLSREGRGNPYSQGRLEVRVLLLFYQLIELHQDPIRVA